jgi:hypothetical protein
VVESPTSSKVVLLTDTDVAILAGLADASRRAGRSVRLADLIGRIDMLFRWTPSFDDLSFGLPRLVAAGLAAPLAHQDREVWVAPTGDALQLRRAAQRLPGVGGVGVNMETEAHHRGMTTSEEDRSLGRLPALTAESFESAMQKYEAWLRRSLGQRLLARLRLTRD